MALESARTVAEPSAWPPELVGDAGGPFGAGRAPTGPRCPVLRPQPLELLNQFGRNGSELSIQVVEVTTERVSLQLVLDGASNEAAQSTTADVLLDALGEVLVDAHRPLANRHVLNHTTVGIDFDHRLTSLRDVP